MSSQLFSQKKVFGVIIDSTTKEPSPGASIYFENTSIGTTSDIDGDFILKYNSTITSPLVFSFVGYMTKKINPEDINLSSKLTISLSPNSFVLDEVVINSFDGWPYNLKLKEFKKHYLGTTENGRSCKIKNPKDLILRYDSINQSLTVTSKKPIIIENKRLQYEVTVDQLFFNTDYSHVSKDHKNLKVETTYYHGNNFYKSTMKPNDKKIIRQRKNTYKGSILHFMRSIAENKTKREGFEIYLRGYENKRFTVNSHFKSKPMIGKDLVIATIPNQPLTIVYKKNRISYVLSSAISFTIDPYGHYSEGGKLMFDGFLGSLRMGDQLPLDYRLEK